MKTNFTYLTLLICSICIATFFLLPAIPQDLTYHQFADQRMILTIPHFWNVITNLPFLLVGVTGLILIHQHTNPALIISIKSVYLWFFGGVCLVCLGSSYYHLSPDNSTLLWDRLPMTIAFMSFFCVVIAEFLSEVAAKKLFIPLILTGLLSVFYWYYTELYSNGDLRFYALIQFLPMLFIPVILLRHKTPFTHSSYYWLILFMYVLAKLLEFYDKAIFDLLGFISGHSLKHVASAFGPYFFYLTLKKRKFKII
ncbi:MAG: ceramidase [Gammaproteobacteria bacterium]|nr:ceramidase [Gammaproteobacteria bacterium]